MFRSGIGITASPFVEGRKLILGGVKIDHSQGLDSSHDSDILSLAICEAILGAANLGEIAELFPTSDSKYRDVSALKLLELVGIRLEKISYQLENVDAILISRGLDLAGFKRIMAVNISHALGLDNSYISIKTPTPSSVESLIRTDGIAAFAVCVVSEIIEEEKGEAESGEKEYYE